MTDPADEPAGVDEPAGAGDDNDTANLDHAHEVGTAMVQQLGEMLDEWLDQISGLVDRGIDPTPLLRGLAGLMRSAADQLDPESSPPD